MRERGGGRAVGPPPSFLRGPRRVRSGVSVVVDNVCFAYPRGHGHRAGCAAEEHGQRDEHGGSGGDLLHHVSFGVAPGERLGVTGPNGGGKSTLLRLLLGELRPSGGQITLDGLDPAAAVARGRVGFVPQDEALAARRLPVTLGDLVTSGLCGVGWRGLLDVPDRPAVLLMDEPAAGLDAAGTADLIALLDTVTDAAAVIVSHEPAVLASCHRRATLDRTLRDRAA